MNTNQIVLRCQQLIAEAGLETDPITKATFLDFADKARDAILALAKKQRQSQAITDIALGLRKLRDNFEKVVTADPMCIYTPRHSVALAFHRSKARVRYFHAGNRASKTESGKAEVYWTLTGTHPYRAAPPQPAQVFIVGTNFTKYRPMVFETKYLHGEQGNPLSPAFPEGGKWFYRYDQKSYTLEVCCSECAELGKASSCPHPKRKLILFSDEEGPAVMAGGQYAFGQLDEQIDYAIYREARERIKTVPNAGLIVTETPLNGRAWWTWSVLAAQADTHETIPGTDIPIVERFNIDQFSAGLVPHEEILASMRDMEEPEVKARIFGQPVVALDKAVFDLTTLAKMHEEAAEPLRGQLGIPGVDGTSQEERLTTLPVDPGPDRLPVFEEDGTGNLRIWEPPQLTAQYVIGVDVAHGLTRRDASCADVLKMTPIGTDMLLEQVAQYHGWVNPLIYAEELFKLGIYYGGGRRAILIPERNGPGMALIQRLNELGCWFLFQDVTSPAGVRYTLEQQYGLDTNIRTKSIIVAALQNAIRARRYNRPGVILHCPQSVVELENYVQEMTESGLTYRFGASGAKEARQRPSHDEGFGHDDRVMSLALATYVARTYPVFDYDLDKKLKEKPTTDARSQRLWNGLHDEFAQQAQRQAEDEYGSPYDLY